MRVWGNNTLTLYDKQGEGGGHIDLKNTLKSAISVLVV